ncbi:chromosome segregation protein SMC [Euhalothece natronophila Z-M001]|uniref:Chromosome partition protein Smc n=1 Tax=Euhalothece natronophila Z-M001 TaxID=522448 RepID=A0A5B8NNG9_9CHRO|nr:chromosome segregation protein SMC [Euhalothece natronophila]QDZ40598.1 chromosome segregation protein SMC [Euhalothece natronophila Z-M001]
MVHVKRLELSRFKSFGQTTQIPLLPGFTVVSGPNGSGKSNILDALLFALGLASSRGMRAERLPDLVNNSRNNGKGRAETTVKVTFELDDETEWSVARRLRVTKEGSYASTFYINDETCTQSQLHEQLRELRIYPEGYNVVLQGDVTRIISMNGRERREIIDELAGVAEFDRKIAKAKETLETVKEKEERCEILQQELIKTRDRAASERNKAEKYRQLKAEIQEKQQWETVLEWKALKQEIDSLQGEIRGNEEALSQLNQTIQTTDQEIQEASKQLETLNQQVKALGEDEQLEANSKLATQKAQQEQLQQRETELNQTLEETETAKTETQQQLQQHQTRLETLQQQLEDLTQNKLQELQQAQETAQTRLTESREQANAIAAASEEWIQQQTHLNQQINQLQNSLNPQRTEQAQLQERETQLQQKIQDQQATLSSLTPELEEKQEHYQQLEQTVNELQQQVQQLAQRLSETEEEKKLQQTTQNRLLQEQRDKQRQLDKLEATQQAQQEAQGTYATKIILQANLEGVCGLVAQLGQVEPRYQLALETAAGGRLAHIVVEDDQVGAKAIQLLKEKRGGRATFLPLNKIQPPRHNLSTALRYANGFIDYAVNLIECEPRYQVIFAFIFGNTTVFETLEKARPHLGKTRIVTLDGEILESSGAMSGGSRSTRSSLHFGTATETESEEIQELKTRLAEIEEILAVCEPKIEQASAESQRLTEQLNTTRQQHQEQQWHYNQTEQEITRLTQQKEQLTAQLHQNEGELTQLQQRLEELANTIPQQEAELEQRQEELANLEASHSNSQWQEMQTLIKQQEGELKQAETALEEAKQQKQELETEKLRLQEKISTAQQRLTEYEEKIQTTQEQKESLDGQKEEIAEKITETEGIIAELQEKLGKIKQERDRADQTLRSRQRQQDKQTWKQQKLQETLNEQREKLITLQNQHQEKANTLPQPLPDIPELVAETDSENITFATYREQLSHLQETIRQMQQRLQDMEPVNMLALEEYEKTQARLDELTEKLNTLEGERNELLLRIENFTTSRIQAFNEAFNAVNENFQTIFATLSDGDGYLELDQPDDISNANLNLVAHPKGKAVQKLHSMSGGEKSLTALSFIFALQRYRPSPFYAFDEVDMFLDGANVQRLANMIQQQAQEAQFIVVSLRRPMIEGSMRTIGVTQARGAYTQVLGIKL